MSCAHAAEPPPVAAGDGPPRRRWPEPGVPRPPLPGEPPPRSSWRKNRPARGMCCGVDLLLLLPLLPLPPLPPLPPLLPLSPVVLLPLAAKEDMGANSRTASLFTISAF